MPEFPSKGEEVMVHRVKEAENGDSLGNEDREYHGQEIIMGSG